MDWKKYYKLEKYVKTLIEENKNFNLIIGLDNKEDYSKYKLREYIHLFNKDVEVPVYFIDLKENKSEIIKLFEGIRHFPVLIKYENKEITFAVRIN